MALHPFHSDDALSSDLLSRTIPCCQAVIQEMAVKPYSRKPYPSQGQSANNTVVSFNRIFSFCPCNKQFSFPISKAPVLRSA